MRPKVNFVGKVYRSNSGGDYEILEELPNRQFKIKFLDEHGYEAIVNCAAVYHGSVKNPYTPSILGVGILGEHNIECLKKDKRYKVWVAMLNYCYCNGDRYKYYRKTVCKEWLYFPKFLEDLKKLDHYDDWLNGAKLVFSCKKQDLDNKHYSIENCTFLPVAHHIRKRELY